ncbi:MAG: hypothetical protein ACP5KA_04640 [Desulfurococcaceae archaeon]
MACFIAPMAVAAVVSVLKRLARGLSERLRLSLLEVLLWGGAGLLAFEHLWHGEVVPWPPFLTAMQSPEEWSVALHEISTAGVAMTIAASGVWASILLYQHLALAPTRVRPPLKPAPKPPEAPAATAR